MTKKPPVKPSTEELVSAIDELTQKIDMSEVDSPHFDMSWPEFNHLQVGGRGCTYLQSTTTITTNNKDWLQRSMDAQDIGKRVDGLKQAMALFGVGVVMMMVVIWLLAP